MEKDIEESFAKMWEIFNQLIVRLSAQEARSLSRANAKRLASVVDILNLIESNPELAVAQSPIEEMKRDYRARTFFLKCSQELLRLAEAINDGIALASHELWQATLIHYNNGKKAEEAGVPGAAQMMRILRPLFSRTRLADYDEEGEPAAEPVMA
jgi:hypothetical protein